MANSKARLGAGNVEIELDGDTVVLRPSLRAAQAISRANGGVMEAVAKVQRFDLDTITSVIALGMGSTGTNRRELEDLAEKVYDTGVMDLAAPVIKFLSIIANGGRPADENGGEGGADPQA